MYLVVMSFHLGSKSSSAGISLMTGLDESGVFHFYYSMFSEVKSGAGGSAIGHSFPTRERGGGRPCQIHEGLGVPWNWRTGVKGRQGQAARGGEKSREAPEDHEGTPRCGRAKESDR